MNTEANKKYKLPEPAEDYPFKIPDGYFEGFADRLQERLRAEERKSEGAGGAGGALRRLRSPLALAATITGFALISFTIIRLIIGSGSIDAVYDVAFLDETGILNEAVIQEALAESELYADDAYSEWEVDAMNYLASNEVNLDVMLSEN